MAITVPNIKLPEDLRQPVISGREALGNVAMEFAALGLAPDLVALLASGFVSSRSAGREI